MTEFTLHPEFAAWANRESARIATLVEDLTDLAQSIRTRSPHPDLPVVRFTTSDIIGEPESSISDAGKLIIQFYPHQGGFRGLRNSGIADALKAAERIWSRPELHDVLSQTTILKLLLRYVGTTARGMSTAPLADIIVQTVRDNVKPSLVWVPIEDMVVDGEFRFGNATLSTLTRGEIDAALDSAGIVGASDQIRAAREALHQRLPGEVVMRLEYVAESRRAGELAAEQAADYMSLLQFYSAAAMNLNVVSHIAPRGTQPYRLDEKVIWTGSSYRIKGNTPGTSCEFILDAEMRATMQQTGLEVLSRLATATNCPFEEKLLDSLLVYGRACYQSDPNDKLLQIMTAIEMFGHRDANEPIQATLADRLAFAISSDPQRRQEVARNFKAAYSGRSGRSHHGRSISDTEVIEQFLANAWEFFLAAIRGVGVYQTREEFLDYLDRAKYGHPTNL